MVTLQTKRTNSLETHLFITVWTHAFTCILEEWGGGCFGQLFVAKMGEGRGKGLYWVVMMNIPLVPQVRLLNSLDHPYIVRFYGIVINKPVYVAGDTFVVIGNGQSCALDNPLTRKSIW